MATRYRGVVLDLGEVTFLASAGVALLHELRHDGHVQLVAAAGTPARQVADLTGLATAR